jgi:BMFP domain-containing protein YqiC
MQAIETENHLLHEQLATTKASLAEAEASVQTLEARLTQTVANAAKKK